MEQVCSNSNASYQGRIADNQAEYELVSLTCMSSPHGAAHYPCCMKR